MWNMTNKMMFQKWHGWPYLINPIPLNINPPLWSHTGVFIPYIHHGLWGGCLIWYIGGNDYLLGILLMIDNFAIPNIFRGAWYRYCVEDMKWKTQNWSFLGWFSMYKTILGEVFPWICHVIPGHKANAGSLSKTWRGKMFGDLTEKSQRKNLIVYNSFMRLYEYIIVLNSLWV